MDRMRESLFAILGDLEGLSFLDLFAGSGSIGVEAASRGAAPVVFVEKDPRKRPALLRNTAFVEGPVEHHFMPAERYVRRCRAAFDLIFLDPPFDQRGKVELLAAIEARALLAVDGRLIIHAPREESLPDRVGSLARVDRRAYGRSILTFYAADRG